MKSKTQWLHISILGFSALVGALINYAVIRMIYDVKIITSLHTFLPAKGFMPHADPTSLNTITLTTNDITYKISAKTLATWFIPFNRSYTGEQDLALRTEIANSYLQKIASGIDTPAQNARFVVVNNDITQYKEAIPGVKVNGQTTLNNIIAAIRNNTGKAQIALEVVQPEITNQKIEELGITTLLGKGESDFKGSPQARTHNIKVGAEVFNGIIVKPGEEFSFDDKLGIVDDTTGYLPELVIKEKTLIPEYGGGLCQVSTTLFRAAMASGLAILERHPHSLPVRYYNPQGYDAAIYPGVMDLKFKNDTNNDILLQSHINGTKLSFEIYGAPANRTVSMDAPKIYEQDPSGALKTILTRVVSYSDGTSHKDTFYSNYKAPSEFTTIKNPLE